MSRVEGDALGAQREEAAYDQLFRPPSEDGDVRSMSGNGQHELYFAGRKRHGLPSDASERGGSERGGSERGDRDGCERGYGMPRNEGDGVQFRGVGMATGEGTPDIHVRQMRGFNESFLGVGIKPATPLFNHGSTMPGGWQEYRLAGMEVGMVPARVMCFNVPAECFSLDANAFKEWQTPMVNSVRVASIAALLGLVSTPLSKGWL